MMALVMAAGLVPETGQAASRTSTSINGKSITVEGGSIQSYRSNRSGTVIKVDGRRIVIRDGLITLGGVVHEVGDFSKIEIRSHNGKLEIHVDGRLIR